MSNPFGEFDDEEDEKCNKTQQSMANTNPFEDQSEIDRQPTGRSSNASGNLRTIGYLSSSRQSISSNVSSELSNQYITSSIANYSIGDGSLQKEGLICPNCYLEFKTITELMKHSEKCYGKQLSNSDSSTTMSGENPVSGQKSVKEFLSKIMNNSKLNNSTLLTSNLLSSRDSTNTNADNNNCEYDSMQDVALSNVTTDPIEDWKFQMNIGQRRSHNEYFRMIRESRIERYIFETNKLLIRLDKLLNDYPPISDPVRRREHEQSIVQWVDEKIVNLCPFCASKFNILTRKKHHCRLCGAVMCTRCSMFIDYEFAYRLITPFGIDDSNTEMNLNVLKFRKARTDSISSNTSTATTITGAQIGHAIKSLVGNDGANSEMADKIRLCLDCKSLLDNRNRKLDIAYSKPMIIELYKQMREPLDEIERLIPVLFKMSSSLNKGESTFNLKDANELKQKLAKLGETADHLSRRIEVLDAVRPKPTPENPKPNLQYPSIRAQNLQLAIRRSTVAFLRKRLLGFPELPDENRFAILRKQNEQLIQKRIAYEKSLMLREQQQHQFTSSSSTSSITNMNITSQRRERDGKREPIISLDDGFISQSSSTDLWRNMNEHEREQIMNQENDPMLQQMSIIKSYIRQARQNYRYEEVAMLEENLKELEIEFYFKQEQIDDRSQLKQPTTTTESTNPFGEDEN